MATDREACRCPEPHAAIIPPERSLYGAVLCPHGKRIDREARTVFEDVCEHELFRPKVGWPQDCLDSMAGNFYFTRVIGYPVRFGLAADAGLEDHRDRMDDLKRRRHGPEYDY